MADDLATRSKLDRDRINVDEGHEVAYGTKALLMAADVRAKLGKK